MTSDTIQGLIAGLARLTRECERHGDVVEVHGYEGSTYYDGGYMATRLFETTFADGSRETFHLVLGVPLPASEWRTRR